MSFRALPGRGPTHLVVLVFSVIMQPGFGDRCAAQEVATSHPLGQVRASELSEVSGLAASRQNPNVLWMHNDGGRPFVYAVSTDGRLVARVRVPATVIDVEDIAIGPGPQNDGDFIYLGDIGDNDEDRQAIQVVRFAEPELSGHRGGEMRVARAEVLRFTYPDGSHNAEALLVDATTGDIFIATKENGRARLYRAAASDMDSNRPGNLPIVLELVANLEVQKVSGGDISAAGDWVILRRENRGWLWNRPPDESVAAALAESPRRVRVRGRGQGENGEAVGFSPDGRSYYTVSEGKQPTISVFPIPAGTRP